MTDGGRVHAAVLTDKEVETLDFYRALNVPGEWFVGERRPDSSVEVVCVGDTFVWSLRMTPDASAAISEAALGEFSTGIDV